MDEIFLFIALSWLVLLSMAHLMKTNTTLLNFSFNKPLKLFLKMNKGSIEFSWNIIPVEKCRLKCLMFKLNHRRRLQKNLKIMKNPVQ